VHGGHQQEPVFFKNSYEIGIHFKLIVDNQTFFNKLDQAEQQYRFMWRWSIFSYALFKAGKGFKVFLEGCVQEVKMFPKLIKKGIFVLLTLPVSECRVLKPDTSRHVTGFAVKYHTLWSDLIR